MSYADPTQPITAGELLDAIKHVGDDIPVRFDFCGLVIPVRFDFCGLVPTSARSYRGYYDHLAFGWCDSDERDSLDTVGKLRSNVSDAMGRTFEGYKGGDFVMHRGTPLWVAEYGRSDSTAVCGVHVTEWCVTLRTAYCEDWAGGEARAMEILRRSGLFREVPRADA